jgi:uncharacterized membrane protein
MFGTATATNVKNNASTATLKLALTNYIKAVNALENKSKSSILGKINNKPNGSIKSYRNSIANAVANVVAASPRFLTKAAQATTGAPEAPTETQAAVTVNKAATVVNNAANKLANLNKYMNTLSGYTNNKNKMNQYRATGRNLNANIALNAGRNGGPKHANFSNL